jgi:hypothetical protein
MQVAYKTVEQDCTWALVDVRTLQVHTPWVKGSKAALEFAHKHCHGWDLEPGLEVTDWESYKRLRFQRYELPRMVEAKRKRKRYARTASDLVEFHPFRAELKRGTGEKQIW